MEIEELKEDFQKIFSYFSWEINDEKTRFEMMIAFTDLMHRLVGERKLKDSLLKKFVDQSTPEIINQGAIVINVELINNRIVNIQEYCEILTDKEKFHRILWDAIQNFGYKI